MGIWIDVEAPEVIGQDPDDVTAVCSAFISTCNAAGYSAGIYASLSTLTDRINVNDLADYVPYWCAPRQLPGQHSRGLAVDRLL